MTKICSHECLTNITRSCWCNLSEWEDEEASGGGGAAVVPTGRTVHA